MATQTSHEIANLASPPDPSRRVTVSAPTELTPQERSTMAGFLTEILGFLNEGENTPWRYSDSPQIAHLTDPPESTRLAIVDAPTELTPAERVAMAWTLSVIVGRLNETEVEPWAMHPG